MIDYQGLIDIRQTTNYCRFIKKLGWKVVNYKNNHVFVRNIFFFPFSLIKILRCHCEFSSEEISFLRKKYKSFVLNQDPFIIENYQSGQVWFRRQKSNFNLTPGKTLWLELQKSLKQLLKEMKPKTRYNINKALKNNIEVNITSGENITDKQLKSFIFLLAKNKPYNFFFKPSLNELIHLVESFKKYSFLVSLFKTNDLIASSLILYSSNMAFYWHNASTDLGRKLFAPTLCLWEAIKEAKKKHLKIFDFEGLWDERFPDKNKGWLGFTKFKLGFING